MADAKRRGVGHLPVYQRLLKSAPTALSIGLEKPHRFREKRGLNEHLGRHENAIGPGGPETLEDRSPRPLRIWNRISKRVREKFKDLALKESELSPRELAVQVTDTEKYVVSEASICRILKSHDLITSPAYLVLSTAEALHVKTTRPNQLLQTGRWIMSAVHRIILKPRGSPSLSSTSDRA